MDIDNPVKGLGNETAWRESRQLDLAVHEILREVSWPTLLHTIVFIYTYNKHLVLSHLIRQFYLFHQN